MYLVANLQIGLRALLNSMLIKKRLTNLIYSFTEDQYTSQSGIKIVSTMHINHRILFFNVNVHVSNVTQREVIRIQDSKINSKQKKNKKKLFVLDKSKKIGTSNMLDTSNRRVVKVMGQVSAIKYFSNYALSCEVPQLYVFIPTAYKAGIKMKLINLSYFNIYELAKALAQIQNLKDCATKTEGNIGEINIIDILSNISYLIYCYNLLNKKVKIVGLDDILITGMTEKSFVKLAIELKTYEYKPRPTKRINIPKSNGQLRPLGISSTKDKVVQHALKLILEPIFEPIFSENNHGFRPNRSCHSALKDIQLKWPGTVWLIELDFTKAFDKINHKILISRLCSRFRDNHTNRLVWKMLSVGYVNPYDLTDSKLEIKEGTPQGSIISPLLANIYFNELDRWVEKFLIPKYNKPSNNITGRKRINPDYYELTSAWTNNDWEKPLKYIKELTPNTNSRKLRAHLKELRINEAKAKNIPFYCAKGHTRLNYSRYADDFLFGLMGTKEQAKLILQEVLYFCEVELKMGINPNKTRVVHKTKGVLYLGYKIWLKKEASRKTGFGKQRASRTQLYFTIPIGRLYNKYVNKGFFMLAKKGNRVKWVPRRQDKFLFMEPYFIINKYNSIVRGLFNYYKGSERLSDMYNLIYDLRRSAALTLAHRSRGKLRSASAAFKKYGKELEVLLKSTGKKIKFKIPTLETTFKRATGQRWQNNNINDITRTKLIGFPMGQTAGIIQKASDLMCSIKGCNNPASEWHHIKHRKKIGGAGVKRKIVLVSAKQIPVCKFHHNQIHNGSYDGESLKKIKGYIVDNFEHNT